MYHRPPARVLIRKSYRTWRGHSCPGICGYKEVCRFNCTIYSIRRSFLFFFCFVVFFCHLSERVFFHCVSLSVSSHTSIGSESVVTFNKIKTRIAIRKLIKFTPTIQPTPKPSQTPSMRNSQALYASQNIHTFVCFYVIFVYVRLLLLFGFFPPSLLNIRKAAWRFPFKLGMRVVIE